MLVLNFNSFQEIEVILPKKKKTVVASKVSPSKAKAGPSKLKVAPVKKTTVKQAPKKDLKRKSTTTIKQKQKPIPKRAKIVDDVTVQDEEEDDGEKNMMIFKPATDNVKDLSATGPALDKNKYKLGEGYSIQVCYQFHKIS